MAKARSAQSQVKTAAPHLSPETFSLCLTPELAALRVLNAADPLTKSDQLGTTDQKLAALKRSSTAPSEGTLTHMEAMLLGQATALQSLFVKLTENGMDSERLHAMEVNMRLALKAQAQCRATLETLATIRNPPVVIARQANIAHGPQQVNNHAGNAPEVATTSARKIDPEQNELLEHSDEQGLDTGATRKAIRRHSGLEAVAKVDGASHG